MAPLVEAELDRRDPDRVKMRPTEPDGFREAWDTVERLWAGTVERARGLDLPWDQMPDTPGVPRDRDARPSLDEALALRHDRMASVRAVVDGLTPASLDAVTEPIDAPGWPPPVPLEVRECLLVVLNEEYHHRLFAERDLDALTS